MRFPHRPESGRIRMDEGNRGWHRTHLTLVVTCGVVVCLALAVLALWLVLRHV